MKRPNIQEKIRLRGKIQLIVFESFKKIYGIETNEMIDRIIYDNEEDIIKKYEKNIESNKYFNIIFFNYDNKLDAVTFLKKFIENADDKGIAKNNSDYPIFVFFKNKNFNKEILYSFYLEATKEMEISRFYELNSHNIFFVNNSKDEIIKLITVDIANYYYEYDFKINEYNTHKIEMLFMGQTGCGKSTFINYLLGKLRAYSTSMNNFKSKGGTYTHSKYPISIKDSEGFEVNSDSQQNKIYEILKNNIEEELSHRTHIAFYLIPGPFNSNRDLDYSCIGPLIKLQEYNIHYYLIMTKDVEESKHFSKTSIRFLNNIINNEDFSRINTTLKGEELKDMLLKIKTNLSERIFSVDVSKKESKTIEPLLNQINKDLKIDKKNNENFINDLIIKRKKKSNIMIDFSGSAILDDKRNFQIPDELKNSPFFNLKKFDNDTIRQNQAKQIIQEAKDVSSIRKIFFCYNSKMKENRNKMLEQILSLYQCKNLTIDLIEGKLSDKEKDEWFYQPDCTEELGNKIISICQEEYKKSNIADRYIDYGINFNKSIDEFGKYVEEFLNFKLNGQKIPYDCELNVKQ